MTSFLGGTRFRIVGTLLEPCLDIRPPEADVTTYRAAARSVAGGPPPINRGLRNTQKTGELVDGQELPVPSAIVGPLGSKSGSL